MPPSSDQDERRSGHAGRPGENSPSTQAGPVLDIVLGTDWVSPSVARDRVREWLTAHRWSPANAEDLVLAVNEAVTNSLEHGYGLSPDVLTDPSSQRRTVEVHAEIATDDRGDRRATFVIRDHGRWQTPTQDLTRGNGVRLMRACTDYVTIDHDATGTTVRLVSRPVPAVLSPD